jgi:hypothetical protein
MSSSALQQFSLRNRKKVLEKNLWPVDCQSLCLMCLDTHDRVYYVLYVVHERVYYVPYVVGERVNYVPYVVRERVYYVLYGVPR